MLHWFQRITHAFNETTNDLIKLGIRRVQLNSYFFFRIGKKTPESHEHQIYEQKKNWKNRIMWLDNYEISIFRNDYCMSYRASI